MDTLFNALAARDALHVTVQAIARLKADRVAVPRANDARAKLSRVFDIRMKQRSAHVVASRIKSVEFAGVRNECDVSPVNLH
mmetsp:Transcript_35362/g.112593  ORF Transcript_35362/g.112593 Transcript_35362/m.112593 type:complete len:82 (+) Transcript_35362:941-1186(+)